MIDYTNCCDTKLFISDHISELIKCLNSVSIDSVDQIISLLETSRTKGKTIYTFGNGGSAATAMHMANDLSNIKFRDQRQLRTNCLVSNISTFSAIANDAGYEHVFASQLLALLEPEDVVIGISASGNSSNCIEAFELAKKRKALTVGFVGFNGGKLLKLCDYVVHISVDNYYLAESAHLAVSHTITSVLRSLSEESMVNFR